MKKSVLFNALKSLKHYGLTDPFSLIALASMCDFLVKTKLLAERLTKSFINDVNFCVENYAAFEPIKNNSQDFTLHITKDIDNFYKELKHQSYVQGDISEPDVSILDLLDNKIFHSPADSLNAEKALSSAIADWLANNTTENKIYCPLNNLINVEVLLTNCNSVVSPNMSSSLVHAKIIYFICNGLKVPEQPYTSPEKFGTLTEKYDIGFSFPPLAWKIKNDITCENLILQDMLNNTKGRFCLIFGLGFTFQRGSSAQLRKQIIKEKRLKAVVELPSGFATNSFVICAAMFFDKPDDNQDSVIIMSLADESFKDKENSSRNKTILNTLAISVLNNGLLGKEEESPFCRKVSFEEIESNDYCLSPSRYILSAEELAAKQKIQKGDTKLGDIADLCRVQAVSSEDEGNSYYEVNASSINAAGFIDNPEKKICLTNENAASKNALKKNDIVFAIKGSVGKVGFVTEDHDNWLINQSFVIIRVTNSKWPAEYVFRQLKSTAMKLYIQSKTIGSVISSLTIEALKNLPLVSPTEERVKEQLIKHERQLEIIQNIDKLNKELNDLNNF